MKAKRILAMLLASMMVMSMATVSAFAEDPCTHENTSTTTNEATCTAAGSTVVTCDDCHEEISNTPIDALGHDMQDVDGQDATCTETGYTAHQKCSRCTHTEGKNTIVATGHTYVDGVCSVCGEDEPACEHVEGTPATCEAAAVCSECGESYGDPLGHDYGDWTSNGDGTHNRTCSRNNAHIDTGSCDTAGENGVCSECGYGGTPVEPGECDHESTPRAYDSNGDGTHAVICGECYETIVEEDCVYGDDNVCDYCEYEKSTSSGGSSSSSSGSSSSGSSSTPSNTKAGIINAKKDEKITVTTKNNEVSKDYIAAAAKSKATLVVNYDGYTWEISDVKEAKGNINLSINKNAVSMVAVDALKDISGDSTNIIDIAHDGELGFKGTLKYNVKKENAGKFLNLYYYNPTTKKLELQGSTKIAEDGSVKLPFTHCSTYVLNITDKAVATTLFEDLAAGEAETTVEAALPSAPAATTVAAATDAAANPSTGNSAVALAVIPVAIMAAAVIAKKK